MEALQRILAQKCQDGGDEDDEEETREDSPPPQPPSPKLLRSKSGLTSLLPKSDARSGGVKSEPINANKRSRGLGPAFEVSEFFYHR